ncbi:hypothetical protein CHARACLAT_020796 [Characodon lateralis]|uniref:Uncharacterized protein n=1 Tax=Characodon lateralis TaxID=208331 RepID=A0ABU7EM35_9TELE|nr:hypothetical protein [Characodon lateralis]
MKTEELFKQAREKVVEKHKSGWGIQTIQIFDFPLELNKSNTITWKPMVPQQTFQERVAHQNLQLQLFFSKIVHGTYECKMYLVRGAAQYRTSVYLSTPEA